MSIGTVSKIIITILALVMRNSTMVLFTHYEAVICGHDVAVLFCLCIAVSLIIMVRMVIIFAAHVVTV